MTFDVFKQGIASLKNTLKHTGGFQGDEIGHFGEPVKDSSWQAASTKGLLEDKDVVFALDVFSKTSCIAIVKKSLV